MKQMKFFALVLTFLMGVSLTSCFDSGSSNSYDGTAFVTVYQSYLSNGVVLKTDDGYTLTPTNPSALLLSDGKSYPERALVYYKFAEGEKFVQGKTSYNVSVEGGMGIEVKSFNNKPDTIKNDYNNVFPEGHTIIDRHITSSGNAQEYLLHSSGAYNAEYTFPSGSNVNNRSFTVELIAYEADKIKQIQLYQQCVYAIIG